MVYDLAACENQRVMGVAWAGIWDVCARLARRALGGLGVASSAPETSCAEYLDIYSYGAYSRARQAALSDVLGRVRAITARRFAVPAERITAETLLKRPELVALPDGGDAEKYAWDHADDFSQIIDRCGAEYGVPFVWEEYEAIETVGELARRIEAARHTE